MEENRSLRDTRAWIYLARIISKSRGFRDAFDYANNDVTLSIRIFYVHVTYFHSLFVQFPSCTKGFVRLWEDSCNPIEKQYFNPTMKTLDSSKNIEEWNIRLNGNETVSSIVYHARFVLTLLVISTISVSETLLKIRRTITATLPRKGYRFSTVKQIATRIFMLPIATFLNCRNLYQATCLR